MRLKSETVGESEAVTIYVKVSTQEYKDDS